MRLNKDILVDWFIRQLFKSDAIREAIIDEVHLYDILHERLKEYNSEHNSSFWYEKGGWKSKVYIESSNSYYFNDIPEDTLSAAMDHMLDKI